MIAPRVVHTVADLDPRRGGPSRTVTGLCRALAERGASVEIVTGAAPTAGETGAGVTVDRVASFPFGRHRLPRPGPLAKALRGHLRGPAGTAVLHDHGIWLPSNHVAARVSRSLGVPRVVSPRGMLSDWALRHRGARKRAAWALFQRRDLESAAVLHATSEMEADEIRAAGLRVPVAVVPNGVELPAKLRAGSGPRETGRALFLSRLHPKKGLEDLIDAWGRVRPPGWELVVAGPDENGYAVEMRRRTRDLGLGETVTFEGPVTDTAKWDLYRGADLFVLPTRSENFGIVVAEALASGLPVITTRAAPWGSLEEERCGWWVEPGVEALAVALREAVALSAEERRAMGRRGRALVRGRFSWEAAAAAMLEVYRWVLGSAPEPPPCVREVRCG